MQQNFLIGDALSLDRIRSTLVRLEETIIFALIERAQFAHNPRMYKKGDAGVAELATEVGFEGSWLEWFLKETESFHAKARRYTSPDEYPFTPISQLPQPLLKALDFPPLLYKNTVNINSTILSLYVSDIVPRITKSATLALAAARAAHSKSTDKNGTSASGTQTEFEVEDDGNYGSAAILDVELLQALSKRIHFGKFVSESKFRSHPSSFLAPIRSCDREKLGEMITKKDVEMRLLNRVRKKAKMYGVEVDADGEPVADTNGTGKGDVGGYKIDVESVVELYEKYIIPLTKKVEVDYLLERLDGLSEAELKKIEEN